jgi:hypothetical protein
LFMLLSWSKKRAGRHTHIHVKLRIWCALSYL